MPKGKIGNRKDTPFATIRYIQKDVKENEHGTWNVLSPIDDINQISKEYMANESNRGSRKYYHDIISFHPKDNQKCSKELIKLFVGSYIQSNYNDNKVYWGVHRDKEHIHVHLCVSATKLDGYKLHFNGKALAEKDSYIQTFAKDNDLDYFPELKKLCKSDSVKREVSEIKKRNKIPEKTILFNVIKQSMHNKTIMDKKTFCSYLEKENVSISKRETGVVYNNRTYRFKTLGFNKNFFKNDHFIHFDQKLEVMRKTKKPVAKKTAQKGHPGKVKRKTIPLPKFDKEEEF